MYLTIINVDGFVHNGTRHSGSLLTRFVELRFHAVPMKEPPLRTHPFTHNFIHPRRKPIGETQRRWQTL